MTADAKFWKSVFSIALLGATIVFIFHVWSVIVPFILGLVIAYLVYPLVDRFAALGLRQDRVVTVLYLLLLGVFVVVGFFVVPTFIHQANTFLHDLPANAQVINVALEKFTVQIHKNLQFALGKKTQSLFIPFRVDKFADSLILSLPSNLLNVAHWGLWFLIIPFVSFFALSHGKSGFDLLFQWTPSEYVESLLGLMAEINATLGGYIRGQLLDGLCVGVTTTIGLSLLGVDGAILLGCVTGLLNLVPFLSLLIGGSLALMVGIFQNQSSSVLFGILFLYGVVRLVDDFLFIPLVVGNSVRLHPVLMLFAILAGFELGGFLGLVFAVPLAAIIKVIVTVLLRGHRENWIIKPPAVYS